MELRFGDSWANADVATREQWQGEVHKAILDASLAVPSLYSFSMWGIVDKYSWFAFRDPGIWPWTPEYPDPADNNPDLLGGTSGVYGFKPAYSGVRAAIVDYFGNAYRVKDSSGNELVRFVENGGVVAFRGADPSDSIHEGNSTLDSLTGVAFAVENGAGHKVMVITQQGDLYLKGAVMDTLYGAVNLNPPVSGCAFVIRNNAGIVECLVDDQGNLNARGSVLMNGVPYTLKHHYPDDPYSTYN